MTTCIWRGLLPAFHNPGQDSTTGRNWLKQWLPSEVRDWSQGGQQTSLRQVSRPQTGREMVRKERSLASSPGISVMPLGKIGHIPWWCSTCCSGRLRFSPGTGNTSLTLASGQCQRMSEPLPVNRYSDLGLGFRPFQDGVRLCGPTFSYADSMHHGGEELYFPQDSWSCGRVPACLFTITEGGERGDYRLDLR